jgi:hypothetical protein
MEIDRKHIAAVGTLETLGYTYCKGKWLAPAAVASTPEADAMRGMPMQRLEAFAACTEGSSEEAKLRAIVEAELGAIVELIEACEAQWGPLGKDPSVPGGKG